MDLTAAQQRVLLATAASSIRAALGGPSPSRPTAVHDDETDAALLHPAGCFVSLHELGTGRLRGCVGHLRADRPLIDCVRRASCEVLDDARFADRRVTLDELPRLELELSVLSPPCDCPGGVLDFEPREHGIVLTIGERRGCFLPQVARDTGWSREQLLARLCTEKMKLPADAWRAPGARLQRFTACVFAAAFVESASQG